MQCLQLFLNGIIVIFQFRFNRCHSGNGDSTEWRIIACSCDKENDRQKEKIDQLTDKQTELIALSERDAYLEGFKFGVRMTTEIYADTQQRG